MTNNSKNLKIIAAISLILLLTASAFLPSLKNGFVNWDDDSYITNNPVIKSISIGNIKKIFVSFSLSNYHPLTILSYSLDYHFFRLTPFGYHLTNLILHLFNCLLVFWLVSILSKRTIVALLVSILFGVHPLHVESVAWLAERKDALYAFFFLAAMISYLYYLRTSRLAKYYYLSLVFFILSLLSKAMAITLPLVLFLLDYLVSKNVEKKSFVDKIPFLILSFLFGCIAIVGLYSTGAVRQHELFSIIDKFLVVNFSLIFYLNKILVPIKLSCFYPYRIIVGEPLSFPFLWSPLFVVIAGFVVFLLRRFSKKVVFSVFFFLITILPALQIIPAGLIIVADRYTYIPSLGIFYGIGEGLFWLYTRKVKYKHKAIKVFLLMVLLSIIGVSGILTWKRCCIWKDSLTLWNDVLIKYPNIGLAYNNRGAYFLTMKEYNKAYSDLQHAIILCPVNNSNISNLCFFNLGNLFYTIGRNKEARAIFEKLIKLTPQDARVYCCIGNTYAHDGRHADAILFYKKAIDINPAFGQAYNNLGNEYVKLGRFQEALDLYNKAIQENPDYADAYDNLVLLYNSLGKREEVTSLYMRAIANKAAYFDAYYNIANLYSNIGRKEKAIELYKEAIKINPGLVAAYVNLGNAYCDIGRNSDGISFYRKALELDPYSAAVHNNLALAYYDEKKYDLAIQHCDKAIALGYQVSPELLSWLKPYRK